MEADQQAIAQQFDFLRKVKNLKEGKLRKMHDRIFDGTKYKVHIPRWMHRSILERRLFYYFCMTHYHYNDEHPVTREYMKRARFVLSTEYVGGIDKTTQAKEALKEHLNFTASHIKLMPIIEVDRYLASLSLYIEAPEEIRRRCLWEWFNRPTADLIKHFSSSGTKVVARKTGLLNNKYKLRDLILENPSLSFNEFMEAFGQQMPTVSRFSFNNARCLLRKAGYEIPELKKGVSRPAVVYGPYGHPKKGRSLLNTTIKD